MLHSLSNIKFFAIADNFVQSVWDQKFASRVGLFACHFQFGMIVDIFALQKLIKGYLHILNKKIRTSMSMRIFI